MDTESILKFKVREKKLYLGKFTNQIFKILKEISNVNNLFIIEGKHVKTSNYNSEGLMDWLIDINPNIICTPKEIKKFNTDILIIKELVFIFNNKYFIFSEEVFQILIQNTDNDIKKFLIDMHNKVDYWNINNSMIFHIKFKIFKKLFNSSIKNHNHKKIKGIKL